MGHPLVSVVVPTYNQEQLIGHTLRSIIEQDYRPLEVIVCDDESTDNTQKAVREFGYPETIRYMRVKHTGIPPATMNAALRVAKGDIIMFLDGDDQWLPGKVKTQVAHFAAHPECAFLFGDAYFVVTNGDEYMVPDPARHETTFSYSPPPRIITPAVVFPHTCIPPVTVAFRRAVLDAGISLDEAMRYSWDVKFSAEVLLKGFTAHYVPFPIAAYRKHSRNVSGAWQSNNQIVKDYLRIIEMVKDYLPKNYYRRQKERWKYQYIKQSVKYKAIYSLRDVLRSPFYPASTLYQAKALYYWGAMRIAFAMSRQPG